MVFLEVDRDPESPRNRGLFGRLVFRVDEGLPVMQTRQLLVGGKRGAADETQLVQSGAGADKNAEGARRDFHEQLSLVALCDGLEFLGIIGHYAGEDVQPAGAALGIGPARDLRRKPQLLHQGSDVDASFLQDRASCQIDLVHGQGFDLVPHRRGFAGEEARADAIGDAPEPQIDAGRLDLVVGDGRLGHDVAGPNQRLNFLGWQYPCLVAAG